MLTGRDFEEEDLGFLEQLAAAHPVWKNEEFEQKCGGVYACILHVQWNVARMGD